MLNPACKNDCDIDSLWTCLPYPSGEATVPWEIPKSIITIIINIYVASAAVAVDSSHMTASSYALWSRFSPPSNFVNRHVSTIEAMFLYVMDQPL